MTADASLKQYFIEFKQIQDMQIKAFDLNTEPESNLDTIIFERNRAFANLRNAISLAPASALSQFKQDVDKILDNDIIFMRKLEDIKKTILKKISHNSKGKQLLKGYKGNSNPGLRFMNTKG